MLEFVNKDYMANMRSGSMYGAGTSTNLSIMGGMHSHNQQRVVKSIRGGGGKRPNPIKFNGPTAGTSNLFDVKEEEGKE
jgi:hypothetical protein